MSASLHDLSAAHGSDKHRHGYTKWYEAVLRGLKDEAFKILEIGVFEGASLRMWRDWFPRAEVFGLDIDEARMFRDDRITCVHGDSGRESARDALRALAGSFKIIVDDGNHKSKAQRGTFLNLSGLLAPGGLYFVEDAKGRDLEYLLENIPGSVVLNKDEPHRLRHSNLLVVGAGAEHVASIRALMGLA